MAARWADKIHLLFNSSLFWGIIAIILGALAVSGRFSVNLSNVLLILAFFLGCFGIYHVGLV
jgi:hypothetical protein